MIRAARGKPVHGRERKLASRLGDDHGSGSVLALAVCFAILTMAGLSAVLLDVGRARAQAQGAADFAALAGATATGMGHSACDAASQVALANRSTMVSCQELEDGSTLVSASAQVLLPMTRSLASSVVMWARAGPVP